MPEAVNIAATLCRMAERQPAAAAIYAPRRGGGYDQLSYRQLDQRSDAIARGLATVGISRGTRTVLMVRPSLELFALSFALFKAGVVRVMVDPGLGLSSLGACLERAAPEAFIGIPAAHAARRVLGWGRATIRRLVTVGRRWGWGGATLAELEAAGQGGAGSALAATTADEVAAVLFTSGSTGPPKGVVYRHGNFVAQVEAIRALYAIEPGEVDLPTFPLFALFDPALGMTTVIPDMDPTRPARVDPAKIVAPVREFGVTNIFASPALLAAVGPWGRERGITLPTVRRVISAGAPVPAAVIETFRALLGPDACIFTPYGATECLPVASIESREILAETRAATERGRGVCVGRPVPSVELRVVAVVDGPIAAWRDELALPANEVGEVVVKGPQVTAGYVAAPEHDRLAKIADGDAVRHRMGDLGSLDERGRLWFCGRKSQRVVSAAGTLYTIPVEGVFNRHPAVRRTALVGVARDGDVLPVLCVELAAPLGRRRRCEVVAELLALGAKHEHTRAVRHVLFHPGFPVDIRHNAKIGRERLARWATRRLR